MVKHTKARSFKISKLKSLLDPSKSKARRHHSLKLGSKLKYLNSDQLPLSKRSELGYSKSAPTNVE